MENKIQLALVEDDPATRARFIAALEAAPGLNVAHSASTGRDMLSWLAHHAPDVLLADLGLPDISGLDVIRFCAQRHPACDIMVVTMFGDESHVLRSIEAGASGYILKDSLGDEIVNLVMELSRGGAPMTPVIARQVLKRFRGAIPVEAGASDAASMGDAPVRLSGRELEVIDLIGRGFSYAETAGLLKISTHTVHFHIKHIYGKLSVHSKNEAVYEAQRLGLIDAARPR